MNQPAPRELCEKLQAMGCVSESGWGWPDNMLEEKSPVYLGRYAPGDIQAFFQNDFTGATERADENCKIVWPGDFKKTYSKIPDGLIIFAEMEKVESCWPCEWKMFKSLMIECHRERDRVKFVEKGEAWFEFLERTMKK